VAILQISRITHRKGVIENLPQLAGAEFGWALDERRLFIGNGLLEDGAPVIGNTEILTEFSDILGLASSYTYKGTRAGYIVQTGDPDDIVRSLQDRFDERVSVLSFGAKGDGSTDDTDAINRAYYEIFCRQANPEVRRALHFPAGKYIVKDTIKVPPHSLTTGDGLTSSIISYVSPDGGTTVAPHVIVTTDSLHQTGINLGNNGATPPTGIEMYNLGVESAQPNTLLLLDSVTKSSFGYLELRGNLQPTDIADAVPGTAAIRIVSTNTIVPSDITLNKIVTSQTTYGLQVDHACKGVVFENGKMSFHYRGANIAETPVGLGPSGINLTRTIFDNITTQGIYVGAVRLCSSAFNVFYNVGNNLGATPGTPNIEFENAGNVSIGDLFERNDANNEIVPRIEINGTASIALDNTHAIKLGLYSREVGLTSTLTNNSAGNLFRIDATAGITFKMDYTIRRADRILTGTMTVANSTTQIQWDDEATESSFANQYIGVTLTPVRDGASVDLDYTVDNIGDPATVNYSIVRLD
jgi:hypothetical protein